MSAGFRIVLRRAIPRTAGHSRDTLSALRRAVADIAAAPAGRGDAAALGLAPLDRALCGGLDRGAMHEIGPAAPRDGGAATGFAVALAVLALRRGGQAVWIRPDFAAAETGELYGPGLALMGLPLAAPRHPESAASPRRTVGDGGGAGSAGRPARS